MFKQLLICLLLSSCFVTPLSNRQDKVKRMMASLLERNVEILKLLSSENVQGTAYEDARFQALTNKYFLYAQHSFYFIHCLVLYGEDVEARRQFLGLLEFSQTNTQKVGNVANRNATEIIKVLTSAFEEYRGVFTQVEPIEKLLEVGVRNQFELNRARMAYDITLYNFYVVYAELEYHNATITELKAETTKHFERIIAVLQKVASEDHAFLKELTSTIYVPYYYTERAVQNMERWFYVFNSEKPIAITSELLRKLGRRMGRLRKQVLVDKNVLQFRDHVVTFLQEVGLESSKLADLAEQSSFLEKDKCKEVLRESLGVLMALSNKLDILVN